ncbi:MAG: hypothetical protein KatS3mg127_0003 [Silanimonas sp.]|nr:MAG: hypothetical protein KatS3mg127_0003 [Silanimonas sp.]
MPIRPVNRAVVAPMNRMNCRATGLSSNTGDMRLTMKMPAVTIVAAWIRAEIGVGPSIESGSQTCSGTCADLPMAPMNRQMPMKVMASTCQAGTARPSTLKPSQIVNTWPGPLVTWAKTSA